MILGALIQGHILFPSEIGAFSMYPGPIRNQAFDIFEFVLVNSFKITYTCYMYAKCNCNAICNGGRESGLGFAI